MEKAFWCLICHDLLEEKWSKLRDGELAKLFLQHFRSRTKVTAGFFALKQNGECRDFLEGVTIRLRTRWCADARLRGAYDKKMRVPLHRV